MRWRGTIPAGLILACAAAAQSAASQHAPAPIFQALIECRAITEAAQRLACYDGKVAAIDTAEKAGDVVVADKAQIQESRKALFGFGAIRLPVFGGKDGEDDKDAPTQIEAKIVAVSDPGYNKYEYTLDNGMHWRQTEASDNLPRAGQTVVIRSGALGSYFLKVGKSRAVRAMRVR